MDVDCPGNRPHCLYNVVVTCLVIRICVVVCELILSILFLPWQQNYTFLELLATFLELGFVCAHLGGLAWAWE